ncbi:hypothetical protein K469DRAFT_690860 [Zopfia rhizophila CBS 207.26]|uniref:Uncharacterized protein n=1 Tax=Zopfia rhizophila CBS 207.26 TaxID=1314779 RepID=A0A6A6DVY7_9PEZI|nr:hypothetical protein K469DRAFT_690860 [Zopfia rhizophila CBS 207.26]
MPPKKRTIAEIDPNVPRTNRAAKKTHLEKGNASGETATTGKGKKATPSDANIDWDKALEQVNEDLASARKELSEARKHHENTIRARDNALAKIRNDYMESWKRRGQAEQKVRDQYRALDELLETLEENVKQVEKKKAAIQNKRRKQAAVAAAPDPEDAARQLEYITFPQPHWSLDPETSESKLKAIQKEAKKYDGKPAHDFPGYPFIISKAADKLLDKYNLETAKRDQDLFGMYIYNDFTGYGLQEVIENQLAAINSLMAKKPEPPAVTLWVQLSAFAHWLNTQELGPWMMMDDGERWNDTVAMIGIGILATLNALERANLLKRDSLIKDIGLVLSLLGSFVATCCDHVGEAPYISNSREVCWPYKIVAYAKAHDIEISGVHGIEKTFVEEYDDEDEANRWKRKECVDRWGWGTKWKHMLANYGNNGPYIIQGQRRLGGTFYDITQHSSAERKKHHFEGKDPLDPKNPLIRFEE